MATGASIDSSSRDNGHSSKDKNWFSDRIDGKKRADTPLISARSALRVIPAFCSILPVDMHRAGRDSSEIAESVLFPLLRCQVTSIAAALARDVDPDMGLAVANAENSARNLTDVAAGRVAAIQLEAAANSSSGPLSEAAQYAASSTLAALAAARLVAIDAAAQTASEVVASIAGLAISDATKDTWKHTYESATNSVAAAFAADALAVDGSATTREWLALSALWPAGAPRIVTAKWFEFVKKFDLLGNGFEIWAQWYGGGKWKGRPFPGVLQGTTDDSNSLFGLSREKALIVLRNVALIDDAIWKAGPATLNREFKRIVAEARKEQLAQVVRPASVESTAKVGSPTVTVSPPRKKRVARAPNPKSAIAKAVIENARLLVAHTAITAQLIRAEIERLRSTPANYPETREEQEKQIKALEDWLQSVEQTKEAIVAYESGLKPESFLVRSVKGFARLCKAWWDSRLRKHADNAVTVGLIAGSTSVLSLTNANASLCLAVAAGVVGGKAAIEGISALRGGGSKEP